MQTENTMLDIVTARQWDSTSGGLEYLSLETGVMPINDVLQMVDQIATTPSLEILGDGYGGSRGWIILQTNDTILHAYIDDIVKIEYFGKENSTRLETDGAPGLYEFIDIESLKLALTMLSESQPIAEFVKAHSVTLRHGHGGATLDT